MNCIKCGSEAMFLPMSKVWICSSCGERFEEEKLEQAFLSEQKRGGKEAVMPDVTAKSIRKALKDAIIGFLELITYHSRKHELLKIEERMVNERKALESFKGASDEAKEKAEKNEAEIWSKRMAHAEKLAEEAKMFPALKEMQSNIERLQSEKYQFVREKVFLNRKITELSNENTLLMKETAELRGIEIVSDLAKAYGLGIKPTKKKAKEAEEMKREPPEEAVITTLAEEFTSKYTQDEEEIHIFSLMLTLGDRTMSDIAISGGIDQKKVEKFIKKWENVELTLPTKTIMLKKEITEDEERYLFKGQEEYLPKEDVIGIVKEEITIK